MGSSKRRPPGLGASKWVATPSAPLAPPPRRGGGPQHAPVKRGRAGPSGMRGALLLPATRVFNALPAKTQRTGQTVQTPRRDPGAPHRPPLVSGARASQGTRHRWPGPLPAPGVSREGRQRRGTPAPRPPLGKAGRARRAGAPGGRRVPHFPRPVPAGLSAPRSPDRPGE